MYHPGPSIRTKKWRGHVSVTKEDPPWLSPKRQKLFLDLDPLDWLKSHSLNRNFWRFINQWNL